MCYLSNWAQYRVDAGKFFPKNVDPNLCTHLIYAFAKLTNYQLDKFEWNDESRITTKIITNSISYN